MEQRNDERAYWDSISSTYDELYQSKWSKGEDEELAQWLQEAVAGRNFARVLDVGCGTGLGFSLISRAIDCTYVGVDISQGMLYQFRTKVKASANVQLHLADARDLSLLFPARAFDLIIFINAAASYAGRPMKVLSDCKTLLDQNGLLFVSFLNRTSLRRCIRSERRVLETYDTRGAKAGGVRVVLPTCEELRVICRRHGLWVRWMRYQSVLGGVAESSWFLPIEAVLRRVAPFLGHTVNVLAEKVN